ncbi:hypothetical protein BRADI_5g02324v3 [Brachypodium distachyon]|uniref:Uncharacterized protein n=1 Tax=Brachypodium distachyon TaxID=15368 RepID=A0A0Q3KP76_BRADI|nr:hypothetical protein BRADI_5g02324v3 [Brachypodium distachyon]
MRSATAELNPLSPAAADLAAPGSAPTAVSLAPTAPPRLLHPRPNAAAQSPPPPTAVPAAPVSAPTPLTPPPNVPSPVVALPTGSAPTIASPAAAGRRPRRPQAHT